MTVPAAEAAEVVAPKTAQAVSARKGAAKHSAPPAPAKTQAKAAAKKTGDLYKSGKSNYKAVKKSDEGKAIGSAKNRFFPTIRPAKSTVRYRQILAAELIVGSILILTHNSPSDAGKDFSKTVEQEAAFLIAFFILSVMTNAGPSAARVSAAIGGVALITLMVRQKDSNGNIDVISRFIPPGFRGDKGISADLSGSAPGGGVQSA